MFYCIVERGESFIGPIERYEAFFAEQLCAISGMAELMS